MKLKCELIDGVVCVPSSAVDGFEELRHDALAAHALMQAIGEFHGAPLDSSLTFPSDAIEWLEQRADEILKEWTGEVG